ncbi:hypothetical protein U0070_008359 [Myodes glareolus]|uniref:Uncharacterized protein n=1 Tax=Myodes glareolus TaxID=447135 RepID=A0AAW0IYP3_MYOGA
MLMRNYGKNIKLLQQRMLPERTPQMILLSAIMFCCPEDFQPFVETHENTASDPPPCTFCYSPLCK